MLSKRTLIRCHDHHAWMVVALVGLLPPAAESAERTAGCRVIAVAVKDGRCDCVLPTRRPDEKYLLILGSLSPQATTLAVTVHAAPAAGPTFIPRQHDGPKKNWATETLELRRRLDRAREHGVLPPEYPPQARVPRERGFYVFVGEGDLRDPRKYVLITGVLRATGRHCQVYVDKDVADPDRLSPTVREVVRVFDTEVHPLARQNLGQVIDVNRGGRFTIFFTPVLGKLQGGKVALDGFVRGSDFYRDLEAPYGNRCDMMYLNSRLTPGPHLRTLLAHEHAHAVIFSEHVLTDYLPEIQKRDEEAWLNEALAHLAEDMHGYGWSNLDYRISAFLAEPEKYGLVVPDYYAAGLWRSHGHRGAAYLFLRWCVDAFGPEVTARLFQTNLSGARNIEVATGKPFAQLFRHWSAALALNGMGLAASKIAPFKRIDPGQPLGARMLCGPRVRQMSLANADLEARLAGTGVAYIMLHSPGSAYTRLTIRAAPEAPLQVSLVRLPRDKPRLDLRWEESGGRSGKLILTVHHKAITLDHAAWERAVPSANGVDDTSWHAGEACDGMGNAWFGDAPLGSGEERTSTLIRLPESLGPNDALVFKVSGTDAGGHRCAGWTSVNLGRRRQFFEKPNRR